MIAEDRDLVQRALAGETGAFDGLVRKYNRMAGAIAFAIVGEWATADDVVQESFITAYRGLAGLRDQGKFKVWLAGIVRSRAIDAIRRRRSCPTTPFGRSFAGGDDDASEDSLPSVAGPDNAYARREVAEKILEAMGSLPEDDRVVVTLKHMEGLSYKEIADITGSTVAAVESRLFRARKELRRLLEWIIR